MFNATNFQFSKHLARNTNWDRNEISLFDNLQG